MRYTVAMLVAATASGFGGSGMAATAAVPSAPPALISAVAAIPTAPLKLPAGTEVALILGETLSSQRNVKGDLVHLTVARDVAIDGKIIIAKGTIAIGELTRAERKSGFGVAGLLEAQLLYLQRDDDIVRLSGRIAASGADNTGAAVLTAVAVGGIAVVVTGKSAVIPAGTAMTAHLDHDAWISVR